jgi:hypothetical protein
MTQHFSLTTRFKRAEFAKCLPEISRNTPHFMRDNRPRSVSEPPELLPAEMREWKPSKVAQHDDITLILVDVLESV